MLEPLDVGSIFNPAANDYLPFSRGTIGYIVSEKAIVDTMEPILNDNPKANVLEIGAGPGTSTKRIVTKLESQGIKGFNLIVTEYLRSKIEAGVNQKDTITPKVQNKAEALPFPDNYFDIIYASQVIHWINDIPKAMREAYRVLKPGGIACWASSGILEGYEKRHFTQHPTYQEFLTNVEKILRERGLWTEDMGDFNLKKANPFFHRYTIADVEKMMTDADFKVQVEKDQYVASINKQEMEFRMEPGNVSMFIFAGNWAKDIDGQTRTEIVLEAKKKTMEDKPYLFDDLDINPTAEPIPLFVAKK